MKEKKEQADLLATSGWCHRIITDPYQVIAEFFSVSSLASVRSAIKGLLLATNANKIYRKDSPAGVLFEFKVLESLIHAAHALYKDKKESPIEIENYNLFEKKFFCGWHAGSSDWDFFPRSLTEKEYKNPYLAFKKFFGYQDLPKWKDDLQEIMNYALSKNCESIDLPLLPLYFHLTKLVEAAHLIDVREITHIGGFLKNRSTK